MNREIITFNFRDDFIKKLTDHLLDLTAGDPKKLERIALVFGGKRPSLFLKRELSKRLRSSFLAPKSFTIDEFIGYALRKVEIFKGTSQLDSCYLLYRIAQSEASHILKGREQFAQFMPWASEILKFIEQLDLENVDAKALSSIEANASIGYDVPKDINELLASIVKLRQQYHNKLTGQKVYSRGLQYLRCANQIGNITFDEFDQILFCNFFYFNRSQEIIVKELCGREKAMMIIQGDERKWPILKRLGRRFECAIEEEEFSDEQTFNLKLHAGFDVHSQIGIVREILKTVKEPQQTVVVLPNSDHIVPLVAEISTLIKDFNISMGYPLKRSSLYTLIQLIFRAQCSQKKERYYAKDYLKVMRHPFVKNLKENDDPQITRILVHKIEEILTGKINTSISGSTFIRLEQIEELDELYDNTLLMLNHLKVAITKDELKQVLVSTHRVIFKQWEELCNFDQFAESIQVLLDELITKSFMNAYPLNINIAARIVNLIGEFKQASFKEEQFKKEEMFKVLENRIQSEIIAFHGSPLKGLQVLGLFETRSLNFKNVIVLDVNEGVLPKLNIYEPLIPREVMVSLGLDRLEFEEEIQRYQFMRLISAAKNVHLVYEQSKDKERSRFVEELVWEEQKKKGKVESQVECPVGFEVLIEQPRKVIKKTAEIVEFLKNFSYSASSINLYLKDPIEFYYSYCLGVREKEDLLDEPEARHVGTFIHELLEVGFKQFLGKRPLIDSKFCEGFMRIFEERFSEKFEKSMKTDAFLLKSVIEERLLRFLDHEMNGIGRKVEQVTHLERRFKDTIPLKCGDIHFSYIIDRIDKMQDGTIMIIDYKTGSIDPMPKSFGKIRNMEFSCESILENIQSFQIPLYFHYLNKTFPGQSVNAALYNLRTLKVKTLLDSRSNFEPQEMNVFFMDALNFVVSEILDPDVDFVVKE